jgi:RNA polymerase sigma factor (TIGR02999 family)
VNELYLELQRQGRLEARGQKHFFSVSAFLMRQILVSHARKRNSQKRGGGMTPDELTELIEKGIDWHEQPEMVIALNDALAKLEEVDPMKATIVDMNFFADLSVEEMSEALRILPSAVKRHWALARVWLYEQMQGRE